MSRDQALEKIEEYFQSGGFESELGQRIAYKTESNLPNCDVALKSYLEENLSPYLQELDSLAPFIQTRVRMRVPF